MPPLILWAAGVIGAAIVGRVLYREVQRVNSVLHPEPHVEDEDTSAPVRTLARDPKTGVYRPE
jgi:hypothetical protein